MTSNEEAEHCGGCKISNQDADVHIQRCSKCQIAKYCSKTCQTRMWKLSHKHECRKPEDAELVSQPATTQISSSNMAESDVFYYVRVSRPYIEGISIRGPFHLFNDSILQIGHEFPYSKSGKECLLDLCRERSIHKLVQIKAPLDADSNKFILAEILTEHNAKVKAALPCLVYHVQSSGIREMARANKLGVPKFESVDSVGTYLTKQEAIEAAKTEVMRRASDEPDTEPISQVIGGDFMGGLIRDGKMVRTVSIFQVNGSKTFNELADKVFPNGWYAHTMNERG